MTRDEFLKLSREVVMAHVQCGAETIDPEVQRALGVLERAVDGAAPDYQELMAAGCKSWKSRKELGRLKMMKPNGKIPEPHSGRGMVEKD